MAFDVVVVGAGPAGLAAAVAAAEGAVLPRRAVALIDDNPLPGGQVWRGGPREPPAAGARGRWLDRLRRAPVTLLCGTRAVAAPGARVLLCHGSAGAIEVRWGALVLATGARERFLPFPGWTLPGVAGAGGLQALAKGGWPVRGRGVVVAGTGPLLLAAAAYLRGRGARVARIAEQAPRHRVHAFAQGLLRHPSRAAQAARLRWSLRGVPYTPDTWIVEAHGGDSLEAVTLRDADGTSWRQPCDHLACGFGLVPNVELAAALGCAISDGAVRVDAWQATSRPGVYCAGEGTGVGGLAAALVEGRVAGLAASGRAAAAIPLLRRRDAERAYGHTMAAAFALRGELRGLPRADTLVCRCEDVTLGALGSSVGWRDARLHTRCGMGACQGRVCGAAAEFLFGWTRTPAEVPRPPVFPVPVGALAASGEAGWDAGGGGDPHAPEGG